MLAKGNVAGFAQLLFCCVFEFEISSTKPVSIFYQEIQEKKKRELLEKDKKNQERLKKRDEEHRMKMDEIRR